jgi:hypothetical protein
MVVKKADAEPETGGGFHACRPVSGAVIPAKAGIQQERRPARYDLF